MRGAMMEKSIVWREDSCIARVWRAYRRRHPCEQARDVESGRAEERRALEEMLCLHCAPTFAGMKAASLVSFQKAEYEDFDALLASYARCFLCVGVEVHVLADSAARALVLIYRPAALQCVLHETAASRLLASYGYPADVKAALAHLVARMEREGGFPHEIGIFLGYPPADVEAFIVHRGKNFISSGYWKVYGDATTAEETFQRYADCIEAYAARIRAGVPLAELLTQAA